MFILNHLGIVSLTAGEEGNQSWDEEPEQTFHEEKHKSPEAQALDPGHKSHLWLRLHHHQKLTRN